MGVEMGEEIVEDIEMAASSFVIASNEVTTARNRNRSKGTLSRGGSAASHHQRGETHNLFLGAHRDNLHEEHTFQDQEEAVTSGMILIVEYISLLLT